MKRINKQLTTILFSILFLLFSCNYVQKRTKDLEKREYNGVVIKKYKEKWNHGSPVVKFSSGIEFGVGSWAKGSQLWENIDVGDSISKPSGTLILKLFKQNGGQESYSFNE